MRGARSIRCITTRSGVVVTCVDDGIEYTNAELRPNYLPAASYDYNGIHARQ